MKVFDENPLRKKWAKTWERWGSGAAFNSNN